MSVLDSLSLLLQACRLVLAAGGWRSADVTGGLRAATVCAGTGAGRHGASARGAGAGAVELLRMTVRRAASMRAASAQPVQTAQWSMHHGFTSAQLPSIVRFAERQ